MNFNKVSKLEISKDMPGLIRWSRLAAGEGYLRVCGHLPVCGHLLVYDYLHPGLIHDD
ncbi:hypothetical protein [Flavitalea sp.]|nr:hypothetical protein [Flavitalea sp.]